MDANLVRSLLWDGSMFIDSREVSTTRLGLISLHDGKEPQGPFDNPSAEMLENWLMDASPTTKIAYVGMKRKYFDRATSNAIKVSRQNWIQLLSCLEILPSALELMHDNNGGFSSRISYKNRNSDSDVRQEDHAPSAYHFCLKLGDSWPNHEHFIYLRHEFVNNRNIVLIAGTESRTLCQRLFGRLVGIEKATVFSILVMMISLWLNQAEENRWELDYQVQDIESRTGYSSMQYRKFEPLSPEQMSLTKDMAQTADSLGMMLTYMENFIRGIAFVMDQNHRFHDLCRTETQHDLPYSVSQLHDTLAQFHSQAYSKKQQIQTLQGRVAAQINVTNTLIAHRDSRANIELAISMKEDARLMKGISLVTMVFLPATFLATFFSMTFFHIGDSDNGLTFEVSRWIWLYPLCTVPLTLVLVYQYGLEEKLRDVLGKLMNRLRPIAPEAVEDPESQVEVEVEEKDRQFVVRTKRIPKAQAEHEGGQYIVEPPAMCNVQSQSQSQSTVMQDAAAQTGNHALQDYQVQLMQLEQQNKGRLMMKRQGQESATKSDGCEPLPDCVSTQSLERRQTVGK
jgi:CorA-like Mg2+ transporter protein